MRPPRGARWRGRRAPSPAATCAHVAALVVLDRPRRDLHGLPGARPGQRRCARRQGALLGPGPARGDPPDPGTVRRRPDPRLRRAHGHHHRDQCPARASRHALCAGDHARLRRSARDRHAGAAAHLRPGDPQAGRPARARGRDSGRAWTPRAGSWSAPTRARCRTALEGLRAEGFESLAVVVLHAHRDPQLEREIGERARELGFGHVALSHEVDAEIGAVGRGDTTCVDAYLTPLIRDYVRTLLDELPGSSLRIMQSSGGLTDALRFRGPHAVLSGPAGGVVACARIARQLDLPQVIGFDMGGTSTDVSRFGGELERIYETETAGVRIRAPMMAIHTVAAGGGSLCRFDGLRMSVGPESAGAVPGPLCYGREGATELTITDVNLALGRGAGGPLPVPPGRGAGRRGARGPVRATPRVGARAHARAGRGGLCRDRRRVHGRGDPAGLGGAGTRRARSRARRLRRGGWPACLPPGAASGHSPDRLPPARRRALGSGDGARRRLLGRGAGRGRAGARRRAGSPPRAGARGAGGPRPRLPWPPTAWTTRAWR